MGYDTRDDTGERIQENIRYIQDRWFSYSNDDLDEQLRQEWNNSTVEGLFQEVDQSRDELQEIADRYMEIEASKEQLDEEDSSLLLMAETAQLMAEETVQAGHRYIQQMEALFDSPDVVEYMTGRRTLDEVTDTTTDQLDPQDLIRDTYASHR
jgi:uncharacterized protein YukE